MIHAAAICLTQLSLKWNNTYYIHVGLLVKSILGQKVFEIFFPHLSKLFRQSERLPATLSSLGIVTNIDIAKNIDITACVKKYISLPPISFVKTNN
jgi:hypothetical protein